MSLARAKDSMCRLDVYNTAHHDDEDKLEEQLVDANAFSMDDSDEDALGMDVDDSEMEDRSFHEIDHVMATEAGAGTETMGSTKVEALVEVNGNAAYANYGSYSGGNNNMTDLTRQSSDSSQATPTSPHATLQSPQYGSYNYSGASADAYDFSMYDDYYGDYEDDYNDVFCCFTPWVASAKKQEMEVEAEATKEKSPQETVQSSVEVLSDSSSCSELRNSGESVEKNDETDKPIKGILKNYVAQDVSNGDENVKGKGNGRRSLFRNTSSIVDTSYSLTSVTSTKTPKNLRWASMARVTNVPSRHDFSLMERTSVWWQRKDYDEFKKAGRIITKALVEGGSEIWLKSSASVKNVLNKTGFDDDHGDSWWCKFGHSRRGLEHITDIEQGKRRQKNVVQSIQTVINEQRKQKIMDREDPFKLATVAYTFTK